MNLNPNLRWLLNDGGIDRIFTNRGKNEVAHENEPRLQAVPSCHLYIYLSG